MKFEYVELFALSPAPLPMKFESPASLAALPALLPMKLEYVTPVA